MKKTLRVREDKEEYNKGVAAEAPQSKRAILDKWGLSYIEPTVAQGG